MKPEAQRRNYKHVIDAVLRIHREEGPRKYVLGRPKNYTLHIREIHTYIEEHTQWSLDDFVQHTQTDSHHLPSPL
jgi:hypothetical protein